MADETQDANGSPETTTDVAAKSGGGGSVLKLIGVAVGLTAIAALAVGVIFWTTLNEHDARANRVVPSGAEADSMGDDAYEAQNSGNSAAGETSTDAGAGDEPAEGGESDEDASPETSATEEPAADAEPASAVNE